MSQPEVKELTPPEAQALLYENPSAVLIDCRSTMEYNYIGHPTEALHVPWSEPPTWQIDINFVENVKLVLAEQSSSSDVSPAEERPVLMICRSGARSLDAAKVLIANGFQDVYNVLEGFEGPLDNERHRGTSGGWRYHGLPWVQS